jgi:rhodanese-related sulfurtransferase
MKIITALEFSKLRNEKTLLLDVRTVGEVQIANIGGTNIPLDELETRFVEIDKLQTVYCLCHHGMRSEYAAKFLEAQGFTETINIVGGIDAWSTDVDPNISRY